MSHVSASISLLYESCMKHSGSKSLGMKLSSYHPLNLCFFLVIRFMSVDIKASFYFICWYQSF